MPNNANKTVTAGARRLRRAGWNGALPTPLKTSTGRIVRRFARAFGRGTTAAVLLAVPLASCVPTTTDTVPLPPALLNPPQSENISADGYRLEALPNPK